jgi:tetratricopeptide (TPR) repeat protein
MNLITLISRSQFKEWKKKRKRQREVSTLVSKEEKKENEFKRFMSFDKQIENAEQLLKQMNFEGALKAYDKALKLNFDNNCALKGKGVALMKLKRTGEAPQCLNSALELKLDDADTWELKGDSFAMLGEIDEANKCYKRGFEISRNKGG